VTDDDGATDSVTKSVTVVDPSAVEVLASDAFGRTVATGWGSADQGGAWTVVSGSSSFSVGAGNGQVSMARGQTREVRLNSVSGTEAVIDLQVAADVASAGGVTTSQLIGRRLTAGAYSARLRFETNGTVRLYLVRTTTADAYIGGSGQLLAGTWEPGKVINLRLSVTGTSPTRVAAKAWYAGESEPGWMLDTTDNTAALQEAGSIALRSAVPSGSTVTTTRLSYDNLLVTTGAPAAPNVAPEAAFDADVTGLTVEVDASDSADSDGTVEEYAWDFGDGETGTGVEADHTYAEAGDYEVTLTVTDDDGATDTATETVTVVELPNVAPKAAFDASAEALEVEFDAGDSTDSDGTIASYEWDFGDGDSGTGETTSHTYAAPGTYPVSLTVTDNDGATDVVAQDVVVTAAPTNVVVGKDGFERTVASGWGTADTGGAWTVVGGASSFSVAGGLGSVSLAPNQTREARLNGVSVTNSVTEVDLSADVVAAGGSTSVSVIGRRVGSAAYLARVRFEANGSARLFLVRATTAETVIGGASKVIAATYTPGDVIKVRLSVTGNSPTTIAAKAWLAGSAEPSGWMFETTDSEAALQQAGSPALKVSVSSASTVPTTRVSFDNLVVKE